MNTVNLKDLLAERKPDVLLPFFEANLDGDKRIWVTAVLERTVVYEMSSGLHTVREAVRELATFERVTVAPSTLEWQTPSRPGQPKFQAWQHRADSRNRGGANAHKAAS